ncbi:MAG TPA: hypothetical protein VIK31_10035, partial [Propionibacteriaceae bacterium]
MTEEEHEALRETESLEGEPAAGAVEVVKVPAHPLSDFAAAIGFLTLLPCGRTWPEGRVPRSVGWYGWVGWLLAAFAVLPLSLSQHYLGAPDFARSLL